MADNIDTDNFKFVKDAEEREKLIWNNAIEAAIEEIKIHAEFRPSMLTVLRRIKK